MSKTFKIETIQAIGADTYLAQVNRGDQRPALFTIALNKGALTHDVVAVYEQPQGRTITRRISQPRIFRSRGALGVAVREARLEGGLPIAPPWRF